MKDDKVIARIRAVRHKISAKFGHDPKKLREFFKEISAAQAADFFFDTHDTTELLSQTTIR